MHRSKHLLAIGLCLLGCSSDEVGQGSADAPPGAGLELILVDSVQLQEMDTAYLAAPANLVSDHAGNLLIADPMNGKVLEFDRAGKFVRSIGRKGKGPGEFKGPVTLVLLGDSAVAVADWALRRLSVFGRMDGSFIRSIEIDGYPFSMHLLRDTIWMGDVNRLTKTSVAGWPIHADQPFYSGPLPVEYKEYPLLQDMHPYATALRIQDGVLVGFSGHSSLFLMNPDGGVRDTVYIPSRTRRGFPSDMARRFTDPDLTSEEVASMASSLMALAPLSSGPIVAVHFDITFKENLTTADGYISLLSSDLKKACVDAPLAFGKDGRPAIAFRGDTLIALEQRVVSDRQAVTTVKSYVLNDSQCRWMPSTTE